jgi:predicted membrane chloride channel (bestrophin family)
MKNIFSIAMLVMLSVATLFNVCFAYSNIDCIGCATMLFIGMEATSSAIVVWISKYLYQQYKKGNLDIFK